MPRCKVCGCSGWFFALTRSGMCGNCRRIVSMEIERRSEVIEDSSRRAESTLNPQSKLARLDILEQNLQALARYEERGIPTLEKSPAAMLQEVRSSRDCLVLETARSELEELLREVELAPALEEKRRLYANFLLKLEEYLPRTSRPEALREMASRVRRCVHQIQLCQLLDAARALEQGGEKARALESYLSALEFLKKGELDEEFRAQHRAKLNGKIKELGGKPV